MAIGVVGDQAGEYGAVSHCRRQQDMQHNRIWRMAVVASIAIALGLVLFAGSERRVTRPASLVAKVPKDGINGILEDTISADPQLDDEYEQSEDKLLRNIEKKLETNVESDVDSEVQKKLADIKAEHASKQLHALVEKISSEMGGVTAGLKTIKELKAKQTAMIHSISKLEKEVSSDESRDLFIRAAAWVLQLNDTACNDTLADCANATVNGTEAQDDSVGAGEGDAEEAASERVVNPRGATRLHSQTKQAPTAHPHKVSAWKQEDKTIKRAMKSMEAEQKVAMGKMMDKWMRELKADEDEGQP